MARRRNAAKSTGPRTPEGKAHASRNALRHGRRAVMDASRKTMAVLGEDPEEFDRLYQNLLRAYEPDDPLWAKQVEDLAKLYWKRARLERARDALLQQQAEQFELAQRQRLEELAAATFSPTDERMGLLRLPLISDPAAQLRLTLSYLDVIRQQVARGYFIPRQRALLDMLYGKGKTWRQVRLMDLVWQHIPGPEYLPKNEIEENGQQKLLTLLDEEIASVREALERALREGREASPVERDACSVPEGEQWDSLTRQENALQRAIDRKTKLLIAYLRVQGLRRPSRKEAGGEKGPPAEPGEAVAREHPVQQIK
jgi:hypothetical protein